MNCLTCNAENLPAAKACAGCQAALPASCAVCGGKLDSEVAQGEFCMSCKTARVMVLLEGDRDRVGSESSPPSAGGARPPALPGARRMTPPPIPTGPSGPGGAVETAAMGGAPSLGSQVPPPESRGEFTLAPRFVGRRELIRQLARLLDGAASRREAQFAVLAGPSGIGKTRVVRELATAVRATAARARVLIAACDDPAAPPFAVFGKLFADRFGITPETSAEEARSRIAAAVSLVLPGARAVEVTRLLAQLACGLPPDEGTAAQPGARGSDADRATQAEARTFIAVRHFLAADADKRPLMLIVDDVERASPETVKLMHYLAAGLDGHPVVLLALARPELFTVHPHFGEGAHLTRLEIGPLSRDEAAEVFDDLVSPAGEPPLALARHAREHLGGSPRALVELTRFLLESGGIRRMGRGWAFDRMRFAPMPLSTTTPPAALPETIDELVHARLAALPPDERNLLEKAAICGESFWQDAVLALARAEGLRAEDCVEGPAQPTMTSPAADEAGRAEVEMALADFVERGFIVELAGSRIRGQREYRFAYPPWREVVYGAISDEAKRRYHAVVAQWLELAPAMMAGPGGEGMQDQIALHLELAGDGNGAARRYRVAADAARARYYNGQAIRLYEKALACAGASDVAGRIQLSHDLGSVHQLVGNHEAAQRAFERMYRLAWVLASRPKAAVALSKLGRIERQRGELASALAHFERSLEFFKESGDERGVAGSLDDMAQVLWMLGRYDEALERGARSLERRRRLGERQSIALSLLTIGHIERHRGRFDSAEIYYAEALAIRRSLEDPAGIAATLNGFGALAFQRGDLADAARHWQEALRLAEEIGSLPLTAILENHLGELARALGHPIDARVRFERCEAAARELDDKRLLSEALRNLGMLELASAGSVDKALALCQEALELAERAGIRVDEGRALVAIGEVHAQTLFSDSGNGATRAETFFQRAVDVLRRIGNDAELGVALERMGTYRVERGELAEGKKLLAEANAIFIRLGMQGFGRSVRQVMTELG